MGRAKQIKSIRDLRMDDRNANKGTLRGTALLEDSLQQYGAGRSVLADRAGRLIAGNKTVESAASVGLDDIIVVPTDGTKLVVVQRTDLDLDDPKARALAIRDNRISEVNLDWDADVLKALQDDGIVLDDLWNADELSELLDGNGGNPLSGDPDEIPENVETRCKAGDLFQLGKHRLLVGDSQKPEHIAVLMEDEKAALCFTSPPYAQQRNYTGVIQDWDALMQGVFSCLPLENNAQVLVNLGLVHRDNEWKPYWNNWMEWMASNGWRRFGWYVWDQGDGLPGDWSGRLAPSFEFIWHFNREAKRPSKIIKKQDRSIRDRTGDAAMRGDASRTIEMYSGKASLQSHKIPDSVIRIHRQTGRVMADAHHPAVFPVALPEFIYKTWTGKNDVVYEPFCGSGSSLLAAESIGCRCYGIEIEPSYADICITRWENLTGLEARKL